MNEQFLAALQAENLPVSLDESLGRHTTFRIGGNADFFCVPATVTQLAVSETRPTGGLNLLMANNPIFLITGNCND